MARDVVPGTVYPDLAINTLTPEFAALEKVNRQIAPMRAQRAGSVNQTWAFCACRKIHRHCDR